MDKMENKLDRLLSARNGSQSAQSNRQNQRESQSQSHTQSQKQIQSHTKPHLQSSKPPHTPSHKKTQTHLHAHEGIQIDSQSSQNEQEIVKEEHVIEDSTSFSENESVVIKEEIVSDEEDRHNSDDIDCNRYGVDKRLQKCRREKIIEVNDEFQCVENMSHQQGTIEDVDHQYEDNVNDGNEIVSNHQSEDNVNDGNDIFSNHPNTHRQILKRGREEQDTHGPCTSKRFRHENENEAGSSLHLLVGGFEEPNRTGKIESFFSRFEIQCISGSSLDGPNHLSLVELLNYNDIDRAIRLDGYELDNGSVVTVQKKATCFDPDVELRTLLCRGFPLDVTFTEKDVKHIFDSATKIKIPLTQSGSTRGVVLIEFADTETVAKVCLEKQNASFRGYPLTLSRIDKNIKILLTKLAIDL